MSARQVRRTFAAPFVVTLAGAATLAGVACTKKKVEPIHDNPPGPISNPPAPDSKPDETKPAPGTGSDAPKADSSPTPPTPVDGVVHRNPPHPVDKANPIDSKQPLKREPAKVEHKWSVMKIKGDADCKAFLDPNCPKPEPGKPVRTCNPPPAVKYACPDGFKEGDSLTIILRVGATECFVDHPPMKCPEGAKCNPPPPRKIACPG